jgi:hypothetical protein
VLAVHFVVSISFHPFGTRGSEPGWNLCEYVNDPAHGKSVQLIVGKHAIKSK